MSKSDDKQRQIANDILKEQFIKDLGSKARVDRSQIDNSRMDELRSVLSDIGVDLEKIGAVPKGMTYCGSFSIHVYKSEILRTAAFATLTNKGTCDGALADAAMRELNGSVSESYGKARPKLRSGF